MPRSQLQAMPHAEISPKTVKTIFAMAIAVTVTLFLVNFALVGFGVFGDGMGYYAPLRSLLFDGDLKVFNEYEAFSQTVSRFGGGIRVDLQKPIPEYSKYTLGLGLILAPFFGLGHLFALILQGLGLKVATNGLSWPYELFYCLGSISFAILGFILIYLTLRQWFSGWAALLAVIGVWFASALTFYITIESSMSHAVSMGLISSLFYLCLTTDWLKRTKIQILIGLVLGLATLVRPQDILFAIVPLLILAFERSQQLSKMVQLKTPSQKFLAWLKFERHELAALAWIGLGIILLIIPQILVYIWQFGGLANIPYFQEGTAEGQGGSFNGLQPEIWNVLFSGFHGLFSWHPLLFVAIIGIVQLTFKKPALGWTLLVPFLLQVYLVASWWCWWQGSSFGGRMFASCSFIFAFGLASLWDQRVSDRQRAWAIAITGFFIGWNGLLILQYKTAMIPSEADVPMTQIILNQAKVIPFFIDHILGRLNQ